MGLSELRLSGLLILSCSVDFNSKDFLYSVNHICVILSSAVLDFNDRACLLIDSMSKLSLSHVFSEASVLDADSAFMAHSFELNLLVVISQVVGISNN